MKMRARTRVRVGVGWVGSGAGEVRGAKGKVRDACGFATMRASVEMRVCSVSMSSRRPWGDRWRRMA